MPNEDDELDEEYEKAKNARLRARFSPPDEVCKRCGRTLHKHEHGYHWRCGRMQGVW